MNKAIQQANNLLTHAQCNNCGTTSGTRVFRLNNSPVGNGSQVMSWCPTCARQVIDGLSSVFPERSLPDWVRDMQGMGKIIE